MAFDGLSSRLQMALRRVTGRGSLTEKDIDEMLREVRLSLLEADVNYRVVKEFLANIKVAATGEKIMKGLNPGQQVVKIVRDELKRVLGEETQEIKFKINGMTVLMTCGLQGAGKTTAIGKMALHYRKVKKSKPCLIAADIYRPAAIDQLKQIGKQIDVPVFELGINTPVAKIVKEGIKFAKDGGYDLVIIDTAGRLHINEELMDELKDVKKIANPDEILLTVDAMTGQDAINVAKSFHEALGLTGVILTKLDGDTRGGAALSIKAVTDVPIKLMSTGEHLDELEVFHPDRMAERILGMGDMLTLIESATQNITEDEAMNMFERMTSDNFNYNDLLKQFKMMNKMGSISKILGFLPGIGQFKEALNNVDDRQFDYIKAIIFSMTKEERANPDLIDRSSRRRERIARGSGRSVAEVNKLRQMLDQQRKIAKQMSNIDEEKAARIASQVESGNYAGLKSTMGNPQPYVHKGKGKNKNRFRF
jgi:signal recognition particle subunit SRP54